MGSGLSLFAFLVVVRQWCEGIGDLRRAEIAFFKVFGAGGESKRGGGKRDQHGGPPVCDEMGIGASGCKDGTAGQRKCEGSGA